MHTYLLTVEIVSESTYDIVSCRGLGNLRTTMDVIVTAKVSENDSLLSWFCHALCHPMLYVTQCSLTFTVGYCSSGGDTG